MVLTNDKQIRERGGGRKKRKEMDRSLMWTVTLFLTLPGFSVWAGPDAQPPDEGKTSGKAISHVLERHACRHRAWAATRHISNNICLLQSPWPHVDSQATGASLPLGWRAALPYLHPEGQTPRAPPHLPPPLLPAGCFVGVWCWQRNSQVRIYYSLIYSASSLQWEENCCSYPKIS